MDNFRAFLRREFFKAWHWVTENKQRMLADCVHDLVETQFKFISWR